MLARRRYAKMVSLLIFVSSNLPGLSGETGLVGL